MVASNKFLRSDNLQPLLSDSIFIFKSFPALCMSENGLTSNQKEKHHFMQKTARIVTPFVQSTWKFPRGPHWVKFSKPNLPKRLVLLIPLFPFLYF